MIGPRSARVGHGAPSDPRALLVRMRRLTTPLLVLLACGLGWPAASLGAPRRAAELRVSLAKVAFLARDGRDPPALRRARGFRASVRYDVLGSARRGAVARIAVVLASGPYSYTIVSAPQAVTPGVWGWSVVDRLPATFPLGGYLASVTVTLSRDARLLARTRRVLPLVVA
jgi:hypothetical protein